MLIEEEFHEREPLFRIKREQEERIKEIVKNRKIKHLIHFTQMHNLRSILQHGLVPISMHDKMNILSARNDEYRIDSKLNCTSCSVEFANYKLFSSIRKNKYPKARWVIVVLINYVVFSPSNIAYYCYTNAAGIFPNILNAKVLCTASAFEDMFCDLISTKHAKMIQRKSLQLNDNRTTDPQAEILISDVISTTYIDRICFQSRQDIDTFIFKNGSRVLNNFVCQIEPCFFNPREDYAFWK